MTHSILDVAHPAIGGLLVFGGFPPTPTILLGLGAAFAGFTAVFALNDVMDYRVDREKMAKYKDDRAGFDLDSVGQRHPVAQGDLSYRAAIGWVVFWGLLSLVLAFILKPLCALLLVAAIGLETGYCKLLRRSHWKALLSGCMVAVGGLAGVFAVSSTPRPSTVALFFVWAFAWEVGGRNIPNDWSDLDEDIHLGIRTFPVRFGRPASSKVSFALLCVIVLTSLGFPLVTTIPYPAVYLGLALAAGLVFLILPAITWLRVQTTEAALFLFNRACFYPLVVFLVISVLMAIGSR
jgi:4-hydroxybenzoate polyprenyltransferase